MKREKGKGKMGADVVEGTRRDPGAELGRTRGPAAGTSAGTISTVANRTPTSSALRRFPWSRSIKNVDMMVALMTAFPLLLKSEKVAKLSLVRCQKVAEFDFGKF